MIGHKDDRYAAFGWAAARLDDLVNLPASRLAALWLVLAAALTPGASARRAARTVWRDASLHRSPNAGWPEAAMAGALGLKLAGPRVYGETLVDDAFMGAGKREADAADIRRALEALPAGVRNRGSGARRSGGGRLGLGRPVIVDCNRLETGHSALRDIASAPPKRHIARTVQSRVKYNQEVVPCVAASWRGDNDLLLPACRSHASRRMEVRGCPGPIDPLPLNRRFMAQLPESYKRYLVNGLRTFGLFGGQSASPCVPAARSPSAEEAARMRQCS